MPNAESVIVGREDELAAIERFLDDAKVPRFLLIEGEAGIGKSTLWRAAADAAGAREFQVLTARPTESETSLSFVSLRDLLEDHFEELAEALPSPQRRALAVALLLEEPGHTPPDAGGAAAGLLTLLRRLSMESPVAIAIDDIQWLDPASAATLGYTARRLRDEPVVMLLASRSAADGQLPELARVVEEQSVFRVIVGPLSVGALHLLVSSRLGPVLPLPLLHRVHSTSGGNPFYALELARAVGDHGTRIGPGEPLPVPEDLHELIRGRLAALPDATEVLVTVAALAQPTVELVVRARGSTSMAQLDHAVLAEVLAVHDGRVRFTHPLLAEVAYSVAPPDSRRALHAQLANLVDEPEERGRHIALSGAEPSEDSAASLDVAARLAWARGAPRAAAELAEHALALTPPDGPSDALRRYREAAGHYFEAGDPERARALLHQALEAVPSRVERGQVLTQLARVLSFGTDLRTSARLFGEALVELDGTSSSTMETRRGLAVAQMRMLDDLARAARHARSAVRDAERLENDHQLAECLCIQALIDGLRGRKRASELIGRAAELDRPGVEAAAAADYFARGLWGPRFHRGVLAVWHDDFDGARRALDESRDHALELGDESALPLILSWLGFSEFLSGRWDTALDRAREAEGIAVQTGQTTQLAVVVGLRALVLAHRGHVDEAREAAHECLRHSTETGAMFGSMRGCQALGHLALSLGSYEEAHEQLAPLVEHFEESGVREPGATRFVPDEIEALTALGRLDEAEALLDLFERRSRRLLRASGLAAAQRCHGLIEAAQGRVAEGIAACEGALAQHELAPMPLERARTLLVLGTMQRREKRRAAARASLEDAGAVFGELGAELWSRRAESELARVGGRRVTDGLTPTEHRVAELVAAGSSNKEVAAALFVTPKTVETTLSRIYRKLGVRSRTELARAFARVESEEIASKL